MSENTTLLRSALSAGEGIVRLAPCWVPRSFLMPGGRLKLHPGDIYALGAHRGGIDERWVLLHHKRRQRAWDTRGRRTQLHRRRKW